MSPEELTKAIKFLHPTAEFSFTEADYSTIVWDVLDGDAPTLKELEAAASKIAKMEEAKLQAKVDARNALLAKIGITEEEAQLLLG